MDYLLTDYQDAEWQNLMLRGISQLFFLLFAPSLSSTQQNTILSFVHAASRKRRAGLNNNQLSSSEHSDTKNGIFKQKINFVQDLSLSQLHILARFGNRCFPPCFAMEINGHLNGLTGEMRQRDGGSNLSPWETGNVAYIPFHTIDTANSEGSCVNIDCL